MVSFGRCPPRQPVTFERCFILRDPAETLRVVEARDLARDLLLKGVRDRVLAVLRMAKALSPKYHVVMANPPYLKRFAFNLAHSLRR